MCHPERDARARGLCASCYVVAQRSGSFKGSEHGYIAALVDEIDFTLDLTWRDLEKLFGRTRVQLQAALRRRGRKDLIQLIHGRTYGDVTQSGIASLVNRREAPEKRDVNGRFLKC